MLALEKCSCRHQMQMQKDFGFFLCIFSGVGLDVLDVKL